MSNALLLTMIPRYQILGLYKNLLRYSEGLKYTDKKYFVHRVRKGFLNNRSLTEEKDIDFHFKVCSKTFFIFP